MTEDLLFGHLVVSAVHQHPPTLALQLVWIPFVLSERPAQSTVSSDVLKTAPCTHVDALACSRFLFLFLRVWRSIQFRRRFKNQNIICEGTQRIMKEK